MPKLRSYIPTDLAKVLQFLGQCFLDRDFSDYHLGDILHAMSSRYRGTDLNKYFWLFEKQDRLVAFAEFSKAESASYTLITDPGYSESGWDAALHNQCQAIMRERMKDNPPDKRVLTTNINASDQKTLDCLESLGYEIKPANYIQTLRELSIPVPASVLPEGFHIRSVAGEHEAPLVAEVHNASFGSSWTPEDYLKVMRTPGFSINHELVVVAPDGRFAAFLLYWLDPVSKSGLFEPVGCHKDFQRRGLTKALVYEGMRRMLKAGMEKAVVLHEIDNPASTNLYASAGFKENFKTVDCEVYVGNN
ncbi:MAG: GNAT family N-acetyltransferase [Trueperaceae bacterium]|nr:GNAT family N-acetyltransferase [Trueperaceae bacterium]